MPTQILFLSEKDTTPTLVEVDFSKVNSGWVNIKYIKNSNSPLIPSFWVSQKITVAEFSKIEQRTKKILENSVTPSSIPADTTKDSNQNINDVNYLHVIEELRKHPITQKSASPEYTEDMKNIYKMVENAYDAGVQAVDMAKDAIDNLIYFMKELTDKDRDTFYADVRSRIDSEFYGKVLISKEEFEKFKKYEKMVNEIKDIF